jgi:polyisoprenoid-binding protein YceI
MAGTRCAAAGGATGARRRVAAVVAAALLAATALPGRAQRIAYRVDPAHSAALFSVLHLGVFRAHGRFARMTGRVVVDDAAQSGSVDLEIDAASVATGWSLRDAFVRGENMFDSERYPVVRFRSTRLEYADGKLARIAGELTLRDVTRPVVVTVATIVCGAAGNGCDAEGATSIHRRDFGLDFAWPLIGDDVDLVLRIRAVRD